MNEPLTDDARVVLAFIRDHPGTYIVPIIRQLGIGHTRAWHAIVQLGGRHLIEIRRNRPSSDPLSREYEKLIETYYPA